MLQDGSDVVELLLNLLKNQVPVSPSLMAELRRHVTALKELSKIKKFYEEEGHIRLVRKEIILKKIYFVKKLTKTDPCPSILNFFIIFE